MDSVIVGFTVTKLHLELQGCPGPLLIPCTYHISTLRNEHALKPSHLSDSKWNNNSLDTVTADARLSVKWTQGILDLCSLTWCLSEFLKSSFRS